MTVLDAAVRAAKDLADAAAPVALVGGLAVSARAEPRNTRDGPPEEEEWNSKIRRSEGTRMGQTG